MVVKFMVIYPGRINKKITEKQNKSKGIEADRATAHFYVSHRKAS